MSPLVTVAVPVYNRRDLTVLAVRSALEQDVAGLEVLAVDDRSTDDVWQALNDIRDPRLRLVRNPENLGLFGNFNRCVELANGKYLRLLCCDDRLLPGCLRTEVDLLEANPSAVLVSTRGRLVRPDGRLHMVFARHLPAGFYAPRHAIRAALWVNAYYGFNPFNYPSGILLRREAVNRAGRFDLRLRVAGDVELFLRVLQQGGLIVADHFGCEVLHHDEQVNRKLMRHGYHLQELWQLTQANAGLFSRREVDELLRQLAGQALGWEITYRTRKDPVAAEAYAAIRKRMGVGVAEAGIGLAILAAHRFAETGLGYRRLAIRPGRSAPSFG